MFCNNNLAKSKSDVADTRSETPNIHNVDEEICTDTERDESFKTLRNE